MFALLFQSAPPDTIPYLIVGYAIIGGIGLLYALSLVVRQRNLRRDLETIERLHSEEG